MECWTYSAVGSVTNASHKELDLIGGILLRHRDGFGWWLGD